MRIERIELRYIQIPLRRPFETSFGRTYQHHTILVKLWADGVVGWGESPVEDVPWYSSETVETAWHVQRDFLIPMLLGKEIAHAAEAFGLMAPIRGHNIAKCGLEQALWDIEARQRSLPLSKLLGGKLTRILSGVSVGIQDSLDEQLQQVEHYLGMGYRRIKVKIKPGWDIHVVEALRKRWQDLPLMVDANSAYTLDDTEHIQNLDDFDLMMIEQPLAFDDIYEHSVLQLVLNTPICLDESIHTPQLAASALELGSCRIINIKPGRVGGMAQAKRIHDLCRERYVPVWCGGLLEVGIGRAFNVAIASLPGFTLPGDISASDRYFERDVIDPPFMLNDDGTLDVPRGPGIGVEIDQSFLDSLTVRQEVFQP